MTEPQDHPITPDAVVQGAGLPADHLPPSDGAPVDGLAALLGSDGGLDFGALMEQASSLQSKMLAAQEEVLATEVEGVAGGGAVRIGVTGGFEFTGVRIDPAAVDLEDLGLLEDLILAALNDATARINDLQAASVDNAGGFGFGDLFGA
jgi:hypothetical protein